MDTVSLCPLRVAGVVWQAHTGAYALTVIVKATFLLKPGTSVLSPKQEPVNDAERYVDDDPKRSIRSPSDRAPYKPRAEVMLVGHAYAPGRQPARSVVARMVVGEIDKSIEVWCDRGFRLYDGQLLEGPRFTQGPIGWEKASGGPGTNNPVGIPSDGAPNQYGMVAIPNVQPLGTYVSQRSDRFTPIGFGPIGSRWPSRSQKLGRYAGSFRDPGWEQSAIPADFDSRYFLSAPPDQQVAEIRPDERIVLENLHPEHARLVTALPGLRPRAIADRATGEREEVQLVGDTLWIDTERGLCCVVWRGRIGLRHAAEAGRVAVWVDGMPMVAPEEAKARGAENRAVEEDDGLAAMTMFGPMVTKGEPALPFVAGASSLAESNRQMAADISRWAAVIDASGDATGTMFAPLSAPVKAALPFGGQGEEHEDLAETIPPVPKADAGATPFVPVVPRLQPLRFEEVPAIGYVEPAREKAPEGEAPKVEVAPPGMIGPIAKLEMPSCDDGDGPVTPSGSAEDAEVEIKLDPEEYPIERCSALKAGLDLRKEDKDRILRDHELSAKQWSTLEAHWEEEIQAETKRGKRVLLDRFDVAYVAKLEDERGKIKAEDYARLVVESERGNSEVVLAEMNLPSTALIRIHRVWLNRMMKEPKLGRDVREAVRTASGTPDASGA